jgi:tetratricopeptide (TPR) repeat protein
MEPLFPWQQIFRKHQDAEASIAKQDGGKTVGVDVVTTVLILEIERGAGLGKWLSDRGQHRGELFVSRDKPSTVREKQPGIPADVAMVWLTRVEGQDNIHPANLDVLGERLDAHLRKAEGNTIILEGLEYLVSQSTFGSVYNFLQFLRDLAQETKGHVVLSFRPSAFEKKDVSLIETLGDVVREESRAGQSSHEGGREEPLATQMLGFLDRLEESSRREPQLLILEDIHWADPPSLKALQFISRNIRNLPVVVIATLRTQDDGKSAVGSEQSTLENPLEGILEDMGREGCLQRIELHGLGEGDLLSVAEGIAGGTVVARGGAAHLKSFLDHSGGNPYSVISAMQFLADQGRLTKQNEVVLVDLAREGTDGREAFSFPRSVLQAAKDRMVGLDSGDQSILMAASIAGQEFATGAIADALGLPETDVIDASRRLEGAGFLRRSEGGGKKWFFSNSIAWEAANEQVPAEKKKLYALSLARWWARNAPLEEEMIARLYHDAQEPEEGLPRIRKAIELTLRKGSPDMILRLHRWLQEFLSLKGVSPDERVREGMRISDLLDELHGHSWTVLTMLEDLEAIGPAFPLPELIEARAIGALSEIDVSKARDRLDKLLKGLPSPQEDLDRELQIKLIEARIEFLTHQSKFEDVYDLAGEALKLLGPNGTPAERANFLRWEVASQVELGKIPEAKKFLAEFMEATKDAGNEVSEMRGISLQAQLAFVCGDLVAGKELFKRAYRIAERAGRVTGEIGNLYNCGLAETRLNETSDARRSLQELRVLAQRFGHSEWFGCFSYMEAEILLAENRPAEALPILQRVVEGSEANNLGEEAPQAHLALAEALLETGKKTEASEILERMDKAKIRVQYYSVPRFYRVKALVAEAGSDREGARKLLEQSIAAAIDVGSELEEGLSKWSLATIQEEQGDVEKAKALRTDAISKFDSCHLPPSARP